jgi:hypothetical protein
MEVDVIRRWLSPHTLIGEVRIDGAFVCYSLEGCKTAIPVGRYPLIVAPSQRFGRNMPRICDVPGRQGILFHAGNHAVDTLGCVLVGMDRGQDEILRSVIAFEMFYARVVAAQGPMWCNVKLAPEDDRLVC